MSAWQVKEELHVEVFPRIALRSIFTEDQRGRLDKLNLPFVIWNLFITFTEANAIKNIQFSFFLSPL
jgi:hypothetical protein